MSGNGIDGMAVVTDQFLLCQPDNELPVRRARARQSQSGGRYVNQTVNAVWDLTDLTYVLRGTLIIAGAYDFFNFGTEPAGSTSTVRRLISPPTRRNAAGCLADDPGRAARDRARRRRRRSRARANRSSSSFSTTTRPNDSGSNLAHEHFGSTRQLRGRSERRCGLRRRRRRRRRSSGRQRGPDSSIRVPTPKSGSWASPATRRPASSACR